MATSLIHHTSEESCVDDKTIRPNSFFSLTIFIVCGVCGVYVYVYMYVYVYVYECASVLWFVMTTVVMPTDDDGSRCGGRGSPPGEE